MFFTKFSDFYCRHAPFWGKNLHPLFRPELTNRKTLDRLQRLETHLLAHVVFGILSLWFDFFIFILKHLTVVNVRVLWNSSRLMSLSIKILRRRNILILY
jgi:hypothetical protein